MPYGQRPNLRFNYQEQAEPARWSSRQSNRRYTPYEEYTTPSATEYNPDAEFNTPITSETPSYPYHEHSFQQYSSYEMNQSNFAPVTDAQPSALTPSTSSKSLDQPPVVPLPKQESMMLQEQPEDSGPERECHDVFFLLVFLALVATTIVFTCMYGKDVIEATHLDDVSQSSGIQLVLSNMAQAGFASLGMSVGWILLMILFGSFLIWTALGGIILLNVAGAVFFVKRGLDKDETIYYYPAALFGVMALLVLLFAFVVRKRIRFAAVHLKIAGNAIFRLPMTIVVAICMALAQLGWAIAWALGAFGFMYNVGAIEIANAGGKCTLQNCDLDVKIGTALGLVAACLLVYFWANFVLRNVIAVTVAGTVAAWQKASDSPMITLGAWLRAVTLNIGSICFGSLIVAILETIKEMLRIVAWMSKRSGNCVLACIFGCVSCLVGCIERMLEFFNRFAFAYIGCYGFSFITASRHVGQLLSSKGWTVIVNDSLTNNVFFLGNLVIGGLTTFIAIQLLSDDEEERLKMLVHPEAVIGFLAFVMGYAINNLLMTVVSSAVTTVFVLWAEDPQSWQATRPKQFEDLHQAWMKIYPKEYNNGYGKQEMQSEV